MNEQNINIQFTKEIEENGKIPFFYCLVTLETNTLRTRVYRRPTHTARPLDQTTRNPTSPKATTVRILTRRAQFFCDSEDSLTGEIKHLNTLFTKNNYNKDFIERNTYITPNDSSEIHSPLQPLYLTYEAPPKPYHAYYDLTTFELHTNPSSL